MAQQEELTKLEREVLYKVADIVNDNLSYQKEDWEDQGAYRENHEEFMLSLDVIEKAALKRAISKLL